MKHAHLLSLALTCPALLVGCADPGSHAATVAQAVYDESGVPLGSVALPDFSCAPEATDHLRRGLALLHNMTYEAAGAEFTRAGEEDPGCSAAYWGAALTVFHPLWSDVPSPDALDRGRTLLERARAEEPSGDHEDAYLRAVEAYYSIANERPEAERLQGFAVGWEEASASYPDDVEIALFRALSLLAAAQGSPAMHAASLQAGQIAGRVLRTVPDHPGALHYTIHAYDLPDLADHAVDAAHGYGAVAPENSHALHMTSHIFTRLAMWDESMRYNERAAAAALGQPIDGRVSYHYLHASDYLVYAALQRGDDAAARGVLAELEALEGPVADLPASAYAFAAVPARVALERRAWPEASRLEARWTPLVQWDRYPHFEAVTTFARGLGEARSGALDGAQASLTRLRELEAGAASLQTPYDWAEQVRIQTLALEAWIDLGGGRPDEALRLMRAAQELEASTVKSPVTPGEVLPAAELLGDMLVELDRYEEALAAYRLALERSPGRLGSLFGAGMAAEQLGDAEEASGYYERLTAQLVEGAEIDRAVHAMSFLGRSP